MATTASIDSSSHPEIKSFRGLARATPKERERVVDFLRMFSILSVVLGHWLISYIFTSKSGEVGGRNALELLNYGWALTWIFQVMPIFFFVGGYANYVGIRSFKRKDLGYAAFVTSRVRRLLKPVITLLLVWVPINFIVDWRDVKSEEFANLLSRIITQPLWFIGTYIIVISLAWPLYNLHLKYGAKVILIGAAVPFLVDFFRFGFSDKPSGIVQIGFLNIFIWLWIHQLGFSYADGKLMGNADPENPNRYTQLWKKFGGLAMLLGGAIGMFFCSGLQQIHNASVLHSIARSIHLDNLPYASSMVGLPNEPISNMNPPTLAIMFLAITQVGLVIVFRDRLQKWLQGERIWTFTVMINSMILTIFCWHQSALVLTTLVRINLNINEPIPGSLWWWVTRPLLIGCYALVLAVFVSIFWKYERWRNDDLTGITSKSYAVCTTIIVVIGVMALAMGGIDNMFGGGVDLFGLFQINPFLAITLTFCGAGAFGVLRNMKNVAQGDLTASSTS